jgi:hypothetical protein
MKYIIPVYASDFNPQEFRAGTTYLELPNG